MTSLRPWLHRHKPRASQRTQLLLAELMWTLVGTMLLSLWLTWVVRRYGPIGLLYAVPCVGLGLAKSRFVLDRVAFGALDRVATRPPDRCAAGFFSTRSWLLVLGMMLAGQVLRASPLPRADLGFLYLVVGTGLLASSRHMWLSWWACRGGRALTTVR